MNIYYRWFSEISRQYFIMFHNLRGFKTFLVTSGGGGGGAYCNSSKTTVIFTYLLVVYIRTLLSSYLRPHNVEWYFKWWTKYWKRCGRKLSWPDRGMNTVVAWRYRWKLWVYSSRAAGAPLDSEHPPSLITCMQCYCTRQLACNHCYRSLATYIIIMVLQPFSWALEAVF
jgi:hypothetical protein